MIEKKPKIPAPRADLTEEAMAADLSGRKPGDTTRMVRTALLCLGVAVTVGGGVAVAVQLIAGDLPGVARFVVAALALPAGVIAWGVAYNLLRAGVR